MTQSHFSSLQSFDRLGRRGNMRDDSAEILFLSFLQEALMSSSGMGRDGHDLMLSISIFSANHGVAHPPRCPEGWFWRVRHGVWHARIMHSHDAVYLAAIFKKPARIRDALWLATAACYTDWYGVRSNSFVNAGCLYAFVCEIVSSLLLIRVRLVTSAPYTNRNAQTEI